MNVKIGSLVVLVLLVWGSAAGCPPTTQIDDGVTTPDNGGATAPDGGTSSDGGVPDDGGADGSGGSADDGSSSGDGSAGDGAGGGTDGGSDGDGSGTGDGDDGSGGDDTTDGDDSGGDVVAPPFQGTYSGQVTCIKSEAFGFGGPLGLEEQWTGSLSITFDESGLATGFIVFRFGQNEAGLEFLAEVSQLGDSVTVDLSSGDYDLVVTATLGLTTYSQTDARIVLNLEHDGQEGARTEDGTGIQVVEFELDGDNLAYSSVTTWEMHFGVIDMTWQVECEGTLSPE